MQLLMPDTASRDAVVAAAPAHGVEVRTLHDPPLHRHPAFAARGRGLAAGHRRLAARSVSLPMANSLSATDRERIAALVESVL